MEFAKILGFPLTLIGLILYSPPLQDLFARAFGPSASLSGLVVFAVGWALLLGYAAFNLGRESQEKKETELTWK